jgi:hypothetical protein
LLEVPPCAEELSRRPELSMPDRARPSIKSLLGQPRRNIQARRDANESQTPFRVPLDVDELEDTQPSIVASILKEELVAAPTQPDLRLLHSAIDDEQWEQVLRTVAQAVKRVFEAKALKASGVSFRSRVRLA